MKSAIYTYHFRRYLGRNLTRAEAAVIGPLEKMRIRGLERRLLVVDPPGRRFFCLLYNRRQFLIVLVGLCHGTAA